MTREAVAKQVPTGPALAAAWEGQVGTGRVSRHEPLCLRFAVGGFRVSCAVCVGDWSRGRQTLSRGVYLKLYTRLPWPARRAARAADAPARAAAPYSKVQSSGMCPERASQQSNEFKSSRRARNSRIHSSPYRNTNTPINVIPILCMACVRGTVVAVRRRHAMH